MADGLLHDTLSPEFLNIRPMIKDAVPFHLALESDTNTTGTNNITYLNWHQIQRNTVILCSLV